MQIAVHRLLVLLCAAISIGNYCLAAETPRVDVILWFDTEDYLLPADDDATLRLAQLLNERKIRATFKLVGEKARTLEKRGRTDVIKALKKHDIGYHSNMHSVHPTPTEYLADCGLLDGIAEFARREGQGAADVRRILGLKTLACYGQPGSSWAPQGVAALAQIGVAPHGIPCYVDEGSHIGLNGKPFWYENAINVFKMLPNKTRVDLHKPDALEPAKKDVSEIADRLRGEGGGLISIFYHPCEWVHTKFWDGVNFSRGANPPREQWVPPPMRDKLETEAAFRRFEEYIDHIRSIPGVHFITASDLPEIYTDESRKAGTKDLPEIVAKLTANDVKGVDFLVLENRAYSVADQFELLALALNKIISDESGEIAVHGLLGPDVAPPETEARTVPWSAFREAIRDVANFVRTQQRVPARVAIGADSVSPGSFMLSMAKVYEQQKRTLKFPDEVAIPATPELLPAKLVAQDTPKLFGDWVIHKEGFRAPKVLEVARLQTWTFKPAIRKD